MSIISDWLNSVKIKSSDAFQSWLMSEVGYEVYLRNKLWDDASLLQYITITRSDNLYQTYLNEQEKVQVIDFQKGKNHED